MQKQVMPMQSIQLLTSLGSESLQDPQLCGAGGGALSALQPRASLLCRFTQPPQPWHKATRGRQNSDTLLQVCCRSSLTNLSDEQDAFDSPEQPQ